MKVSGIRVGDELEVIGVEPFNGMLSRRFLRESSLLKQSPKWPVHEWPKRLER